MRRLICRVFGHQWITTWEAGPWSKAYDALACTRCKANGWRA